ncbi:hypothetical protein [Mesorhizobium sp. WSM4887]|uniref:hypothetical protein n=1 Tax=Mesorhizobium sp. WSM4887 TaxID=3038543 RepID=UPI002415AA9A|nr:hypothetical protein [Mesorhizobium sp. WSM4887]MDG4890913.1 hypothetical protein [Mesorhizobium sp. WSM4887]
MSTVDEIIVNALLGAEQVRENHSAARAMLARLLAHGPLKAEFVKQKLLPFGIQMWPPAEPDTGVSISEDGRLVYIWPPGHDPRRSLSLQKKPADAGQKRGGFPKEN